MTTNIVESLNSILMDEREHPVSYIFNSIAKKFGEKFRKRHAFVGGKKNIFVPSVKRILRDNKSASDSLYVGNPNGVLDEYTVFGNGVTAKVNLLERSCSCRKFDLVKIPCEHAMAALRAKYGDDEDYAAVSSSASIVVSFSASSFRSPAAFCSTSSFYVFLKYITA
ncbi:uncharacterized protein LOC124898486 [Capsicum annuum]|uniref:uncharacterized protein LOC124898486 n=1 Tax=Capsicum annuum TaxID=4072 RepID=UPI001FB09711|nr:uncharacterized protein LOC124898486 [Capsicum annuum]